MSGPGISGTRVLGLWLLYAVAGIFLAIAASAAADVNHGGGGEKESPTRFSTKVVGGLSGVSLICGALLSYLATTEGASVEAIRPFELGGYVGGAVLSVTAWVLIARDLRGGVNG